MLCDRKTTNIYKCIAPFISHAIDPLLDCLITLSPQLFYLKERTQANGEHWTAYQESNKDKLIYKKKFKGGAKLNLRTKLWIGPKE